MSRMRWSGLGLAVVLLLGVSACTGSPAAVTGSSAPETATSVPPSMSTEMSTPRPLAALAPTPSPTAATTSPASALGDLAAFIDAARAADTRLHAATVLINGSIRTDAVVVDERTATAVRAIDVSVVTPTIPAGMPAELMRQVLTTYSDLVSRERAVSRFRYAARTDNPAPAVGETGLAEGQDIVQCLANGSPAAHRFDTDLAAVVTTAGATPPLPTLDPASLAFAELEARVQEIVLLNAGCGACGGHVATKLSTIVWDDAATSARTRTGTIVDQPDGAGTGDGGGVPFTATYVPGAGWTVEIHAC